MEVFFQTIRTERVKLKYPRSSNWCNITHSCLILNGTRTITLRTVVLPEHVDEMAKEENMNLISPTKYLQISEETKQTDRSSS